MASPSSARSSAASVSVTTVPLTTPGHAGRPVASTVAYSRASGSTWGLSSVSAWSGLTRSSASAGVISPSRSSMTASLTAAVGERLPAQQPQAPLLDRELDVHHVPVLLLELRGRLHQLGVEDGERVL